MDTTDSCDVLDFILGDPGLIADTRIEDEAEALGQADADAGLQAALAEFDRSRDLSQPSAGCVLRLQAPAADDLTMTRAHHRVLERMKAAIRSPDQCVRTDNGDYALALAGCDTETARKRVALMIRLVQLDPMFLASTILWAGIAPVQGDDSSVSLRTARLACDLASFQDSGHIEVVEL